MGVSEPALVGDRDVCLHGRLPVGEATKDGWRDVLLESTWIGAESRWGRVSVEPHRRDMFRGLLATINRCWIDTRVSPPAPAAPFVLGAAMAGVAAVGLLVAVPGESVGSAALIADDDSSILLGAIN